MRKITYTIVFFIGLSIIALNDAFDKIKEKKWDWAALAFVVLAILIPLLVVYFRKLKNYNEKDQRK